MRNYISLFLLILLCGCELTLDVDIPHDKESLVVNSIFAADSLWQAGVSYDRAILDDTPFKPVEDAEVVIYDESGPVETLKLNEYKVYRAATNKPVPGKRYEIRVNAPGHDPVSAVAYIPRATEIVSVKTRDAFIDDDTPATAFDITIKDDPSEQNYYRVFVATESYIINPSTNEFSIFYGRVRLESDDPLLADENNLSEGGVLIKDALFNGKEARLSVKMWGDLSRYRSQGKVRVNVQTLSKEAYDYFITAQLQYNTSDDPLAQPVKVFNNIEGGFGIFAGYNQSTFYLQSLPGPVITSITPMSGRAFDEIIIEGSNFSVNSWEIQVLFRGKGFQAARIMESTSTRIRCEVPMNAVTGPVLVWSRGGLTTSTEDFVVTD